MGILSFITGKHFDEQPDEDEGSDASDYERGQQFAREEIDARRRNPQQYGYDSFMESVQTGGKIWHEMVLQEQDRVNQGRTERQARLDYARGARSQYD
jgi:hypothetical protein